jgi:hypothetical protein
MRACADELQGKIDSVCAIMEKRNLTHIVVYGDREHFANLTYLTGYDPRYEEGILVIGHKKTPLLLVGNEGEAHAQISLLVREGKLRTERFQTLSLVNQPRENSRKLEKILRDEGITVDSKIGCIGWKYFKNTEQPDPVHAIDLPAYIVDTLRRIVGWEDVINVTDILIDPDYGLRTYCTPWEIAYFEYTNILASEGIRNMLFGMQEGMLDYDVVRLCEYSGQPLGTHISFITNSTHEYGISGPMGFKIKKGDPLSVNLSYWGSNCCRAGWIANSAQDLKSESQYYVERFAGIYFEVMNEWFQLLRLGEQGGTLWKLMHDRLPYKKFHVFLNPGHLIHLDEWVSSPFYKDSIVRLHSGAAIQTDVIPKSPVYFSTRMEDGVILADKELQKRLKEQFPKCYNRCQDRREFMIGVLGIDLPDEVLPLSNIPGIVPPFFLQPNCILALQ